MSTDSKHLIAAVAAEADTTRDEPMPADAVATKPNKSVTVATRLLPEDAEAVETLASRLGVPVSALVRGWVLAGLAAKNDESVAAALDRLSADVQRLRELVV